MIAANDYASVQLNIAKVDQSTGMYTKECHTIALAGYIRTKVSSERGKGSSVCNEENLEFGLEFLNTIDE